MRMVKRILFALDAIVALWLIGIFLREIPGGIRELRMWRMARFKQPTSRSAGTQTTRQR